MKTDFQAELQSGFRTSCPSGEGGANTGFDVPVRLENSPLIESVLVNLPAPSLSDNTAYLDRFTRAIERMGFSPVGLDPRRMDEWVRKMRSENLSFRAVLGFVDSRCEVLDVIGKSSDAAVYGFAVDLGSTTLIIRLIDISHRKIIEQLSINNPQTAWGEDILSRIIFARNQEGLLALRESLLQACAAGMKKILAASAIPPDRVYAMACAGNTAMSHFFWGLDPSNISREPYIPAANSFPMVRAADLGFDFLPHALLYLFPNVGSYVGGDIVSGAIAADLTGSADTRMLIDVGTNVEVMFGNREWLLTCAGAAGPALEGAVVERGMQALPGAIEWVRIDRESLEPDFRVIAGGKAAGICGSGLIELLAEMFSSGILTVEGKLNADIDCPRFRNTPDGRAFALALSSQTVDGREILISEIDIGIFLKSKAAMYAILSLICGKVGLRFADLKDIYIAGNFGSHIDPEMAIRLGMVPDLPRKTYHGIGNSSLLGTSMLLCDRSLLAEVEKVRSMITYVELNVNVELMNEFRGALFIPHTNSNLFPSVQMPQQA